MLTTWLVFTALHALQGTTVEPSRHCLRIIEPQCGKVKDLDVSADGERLVVGCDNGHVKVYDLATGMLLRDLFGSGTVTDVEFDLRGERLLAAYYDRTRIWNARSFELEQSLKGQRLGMLRACFSPDGRWVATGSCGSGAEPDQPTEARVWNASTGEQVALVEDLAFRVLPSFSPESTRLLASSGNVPELFVLELGGKRAPRKLKAHSKGIAYSAWSPDGKTVLSVSSDLTGRLWNAESGKVLHVLEGHTGYLLRCEFSPDGLEASTTSWADRTTRVWNVKSGKERLELEGHDERPTAVHYAPDGRAIASFDAAGRGILFELQRGKIVARFDGHTDITTAIDFRPDSKWIVSGSYDGTVRVWSNPLVKE